VFLKQLGLTLTKTTKINKRNTIINAGD
jgi:hypothetical protein